jgi:hypothetical protein
MTLHRCVLLHKRSSSAVLKPETLAVAAPILSSENKTLSRMASSGMVHRVALVRNDVSEERSASFIRVTRIGELETTLAVASYS